MLQGARPVYRIASSSSVIHVVKSSSVNADRSDITRVARLRAEISTHLWKVGEKRFFKSLPLAPFFTNFAALLALFTFSSALAYVIVVVSRLALIRTTRRPKALARLRPEARRPSSHASSPRRRRREGSTRSFYPSFVSTVVRLVVVARTLLRRRHLRRRASVKGGPRRDRDLVVLERDDEDENPTDPIEQNHESRLVQNESIILEPAPFRERYKKSNRCDPSIHRRGVIDENTDRREARERVESERVESDREKCEICADGWIIGPPDRASRRHSSARRRRGSEAKLSRRLSRTDNARVVR
jgi:hypothetical protein